MSINTTLGHLPGGDNANPIEPHRGKGEGSGASSSFANWGQAFSLRATQMKTEDHATSDRQFAE
jgi:hypothetical protein